METLKICLFTADFPPYTHGGVAEYSFHLFKELKKLNQDIHLITCSPIGGQARRKNIHNFTLPYRSLIRYPLFAIASLKEKRTCDIIHSLTPYCDMGLSRFFTDRFVVTIHNTFAQELRMGHLLNGWKRHLYHKFYSIVEQTVTKSAKKIIAVSKGTKQDIINSYDCSPSKVEVIYNGIDLENFRKKEYIDVFSKYKIPKEDYLLFVGRIIPRKGIEYLLYSLRKVIECKIINLLLVGEAEPKYKEKLNIIIEDLQLKKYVFFLDYVPKKDLLSFYNYCSVFVFPSLVEGFGLVLLEAMAFGKPIVAFNIPGVNKIVKNNKTGILVPTKDIEGFAEAINTVMENENLRKKMANLGKKEVEKFSWKETAEKVYNVYKSL